MTDQKQDITKSLYAPSEVATEALRTVEEYQRDIGVPTGIAYLDKVMNPMRGGMRIPVLANTSHFKTSFMDLVARNVASTCVENEAVVFATWEDAVDEIGIKNLAAYTRIPVTKMVRGELTDAEWRALRQAAIERGKKPLWLIGGSTAQYRKMQLPTLPEVWRILEYMVDVQQVKPRLVVLDYLQRIRPHTRGDRRVQIIDMLDMIYNMAIAFDVPVMFGVQANRVVAERKWKQPQMSDALESSSIEHIASAFLSLQLAHKNYPLGETLDVAGRSFIVDEGLLFVELLKQKSGPAPKLTAFHVDYETNSLAPILD